VEDGFEQLEQKVKKAADLVRRLQGENKELRAELVRAQGRIGEVERRLESADKRHAGSDEDGPKLEALSREVRTLRQEREEIRTRIAKLVDVLDALE
jgi:predicted RNase H-like nuclease (RuvC/YqgF family)